MSSRELVAAAAVSVSNKRESLRMVCGRPVEESGTSWPGKTDGSCSKNRTPFRQFSGTERGEEQDRNSGCAGGRGEISCKTIEKVKLKRALDRPIAGEDLPSPVRWRAW